MAKCKISESGAVLFECPACECLHAITYDRPNGMGSQWSWNGSTDAPTFSPSVLVRANYTSIDRLDDVCHSFVVDGRIQFLSDCTHKLAGQTVELPDWETD